MELDESTVLSQWQRTGLSRGRCRLAFVTPDYESLPIKNENHTFGLPVDKMYKLSRADFWKSGEQLEFSLAGRFGTLFDARPSRAVITWAGDHTRLPGHGPGHQLGMQDISR